jgi:hypothetical protein
VPSARGLTLALDVQGGQMHILTAQREKDCDKAFIKYKEYLIESKNRFPKKAYKLATSDWYFNFDDRRCPHDSWLEEINIFEPAKGDRNEKRVTSIRVKLLGAYHDRYIEMFYPKVYSYKLIMRECKESHCDWIYDEFRLSTAGNIIHEIEWAGIEDRERWIIEASDVIYKQTLINNMSDI